MLPASGLVEKQSRRGASVWPTRLPQASIQNRCNRGLAYDVHPKRVTVTIRSCWCCALACVRSLPQLGHASFGARRIFAARCRERHQQAWHQVVVQVPSKFSFKLWQSTSSVEECTVKLHTFHAQSLVAVGRVCDASNRSFTELCWGTLRLELFCFANEDLAP